MTGPHGTGADLPTAYGPCKAKGQGQAAKQGQGDRRPSGRGNGNDQRPTPAAKTTSTCNYNYYRVSLAALVSAQGREDVEEANERSAGVRARAVVQADTKAQRRNRRH